MGRTITVDLRPFGIAREPFECELPTYAAEVSLWFARPNPAASWRDRLGRGFDFFCYGTFATGITPGGRG